MGKLTEKSKENNEKYTKTGQIIIIYNGIQYAN